MSKAPSSPMHQYLANCIWRIMRSPCLAIHDMRRCEDIAWAITVADEVGEWASHEYLQSAVKFAEAGGYKKKTCKEIT